MIPRRWLLLYGLPAMGFLSLLGLWEGGSVLLGIPQWLLPQPSRIAVALVRWGPLLLFHSGITALETFLGFLLAIAVGVPLAVFIVYSPLLRNTLYPLLIVTQSMPKVAIAPIFLIWVGYGLQSKVLMALLIAFFPIVIDTVTGFRSVDPDLVNLTRSLDASQWQIFREIRFPSALPHLFSGFKVAVTLALIGAVVGEFVGADQGLGNVILVATGQVKTDVVFAAIVLLSVMGLFLFGLVALAEYLLVPWARTVKEPVLVEGEEVSELDETLRAEEVLSAADERKKEMG